MLSNLDIKQKELANYMSELSEIAYSASWMKDLEYHLWAIKIGSSNTYGRLQINEEIIEKLDKLSRRINGWIYFDDDSEETFISLNKWQEKFIEYQSIKYQI